jgi:EPS-associated MarR family transcriptional regulator
LRGTRLATSGIGRICDYHGTRSTSEQTPPDPTPASTLSREDLHYQLLRRLTQQPAASQRSLATQLGVSVGKINYCLRALLDKGWVKANNFRRSDNKLAYAYLLTPTGVSAKLQMTRDFLARKEREFEALHSEIDSLRVELMSERVSSQPTAARQAPNDDQKGLDP